MTQKTVQDLLNAALRELAADSNPTHALEVNPRAAAKYFTLLASAARASNFTSTAVTGLQYYKQAIILLDVTAASGTTPTLDVRLWTGASTAGLQTGSLARFTEMTTTGKRAAWIGLRGSLADFDANATLNAGTIRAAGALLGAHWGDRIYFDVIIGGTTPSFTFGVYAWMIP